MYTHMCVRAYMYIHVCVRFFVKASEMHMCVSRVTC